MGHLFILFPAVLILGFIIHRAFRKDVKREATARTFRNFFFTWAVCSGIMGTLAVFSGSALAIGLSLAFGIPFIYFAGAVLMFLPFLLYRKGLGIAKFLSVIIVLWGILVGVIIYVNATGQLENVGALKGLFSHVFANIKYYHLFGLSIIFVPLGLFFLREASKSVSPVVRVQSILIGFGIIIAGISEGFHAWVLNPVGFDFPDYMVPLGFLLILIGILYSRFAKQTT